MLWWVFFFSQEDSKAAEKVGGEIKRRFIKSEWLASSCIGGNAGQSGFYYFPWLLPVFCFWILALCVETLSPPAAACLFRTSLSRGLGGKGRQSDTEASGVQPVKVQGHLLEAVMSTGSGALGGCDYWLTLKIDTEATSKVKGVLLRTLLCVLINVLKSTQT